MKNDRDNLEKMYHQMQEENNNNIKKWNDSLTSKTILLFPLLIFCITFLRVNNDKSILDLFAFIAVGLILVLLGLFLNFLLSKSN